MIRIIGAAIPVSEDIREPFEGRGDALRQRLAQRVIRLAGTDAVTFS
jgi:hypothetical protein